MNVLKRRATKRETAEYDQLTRLSPRQVELEILWHSRRQTSMYTVLIALDSLLAGLLIAIIAGMGNAIRGWLG